MSTPNEHSSTSLASSSGSTTSTASNASTNIRSSPPATTATPAGVPVGELFEVRCQSQYLQSKLSTTYDQLKSSFKEAVDKKNSSRIQAALQNLTYYRVEKDLLDPLLSVISMTDDKKTLKLAYYFLIELSEIKNITTIFSKEMQHKDISRKVVSLKTTAMLAPNDTLVDANITEVISGILRKVGEDPDKVQKKKVGFFTKVSDLGRERALLQYACFVACRNRFKNNPSLFMPIVEGIKCADPVGARHAVCLTHSYAKDDPATIAATIKRFLPLLKANRGKEAVALVDPFARRTFLATCSMIALSSSPDGKDFFQNICQSVMDNNLGVWCSAVSNLTKFPWKTLETAMIEAIVVDNDTPNHYDTQPTAVPLITGICNQIKNAFNTHFTAHPAQQSIPFTHMVCKLVNALSHSYVRHAYPKAADGSPAIGTWTEVDKTIPSSLTHPFSVLTSSIMGLLSISPNISIRIQALRALVWLCPSTLCPASRTFFECFRNQLREQCHPALLFKELFMELYKRTVVTPVLAPSVLQLVYDWIDIVPHKVDTPLAIQIWTKIIEFGREGRERVLQNCFDVLDRSIHPDFRVVSLEILKDIVQFLGDNANKITLEGEAGDNQPVTDQALNSIILRLEQYAIFHPWQIRMASVDALAKIAFLSSTPFRIHIYHFLTTVPNGSHGWTTVKSNNATIVCILDQLLTLRSKWLPLLSSSLSAPQKKELTDDHNSMLLQIGMYFDSVGAAATSTSSTSCLPSDYMPLGVETRQYVK
ncbi:hypothetical protein SAMD00019534_064390 [Acytostelium subglobosum LB1]|uniref:hypothetical protein n=1 Tax=Acytostelium subglobosum LB1 TaxID=1410327 RepID=UPI000644BE33|nr:hypothetical protein SAMD00019534_064390 [Acytostelium subglobosum LB1]GAM23264.1 hypothetical protein SAMD00019534_064390 [Acytostelium subglobosum LB1]|eukprot:XP_012753713.1 hypothetical protein SAMD00019534_064390 [Acytostelium subglobosum LB1]